MGDGTQTTCRVSIHAPLRREERHIRRANTFSTNLCFNPRPPPKRGATLC